MRRSSWEAPPAVALRLVLDVDKPQKRTALLSAPLMGAEQASSLSRTARSVRDFALTGHWKPLPGSWVWRRVELLKPFETIFRFVAVFATKPFKNVTRTLYLG